MSSLYTKYFSKGVTQKSELLWKHSKIFLIFCGIVWLRSQKPKLQCIIGSFFGGYDKIELWIKVSRFFWFMVYFCLSWIRKILRNMKSLEASAQQPICQMLSDHFRQKKILATTKWLNKVNLWEFECRQSCFWKKKFFVCQMWWFQKHSYRGLLFRLNWLMKIFWWNWI